jgi:hypothetical protein
VKSDKNYRERSKNSGNVCIHANYIKELLWGLKVAVNVVAAELGSVEAEKKCRVAVHGVFGE